MDNFSKPPSAPSDPHSPVIVSLLVSNADILAARDELDAWLRNQHPSMDSTRAFDIVLAATELVSNAFEHGQGGCLFDMRTMDQNLTITVTNDAQHAALPPPASWAMPNVSQTTGRGLAIVKAVADDVSLAASTTSVSIAATFDLSMPTAPISGRTTAVAS